MFKRLIYIISFILSLISCQKDLEIYPKYENFVREYNLDVKKVNFELEENDNIIAVSAQKRIKELLSEKKFKACGYSNLFKINFEKVRLDEEIVGKDRIFTLVILIKLEAYTEDDLIFPNFESKYKVSLTRSISSNSNVEVQAKFIDDLIHEIGFMLSDEIDNNFKQNFAKFILI